MTLNRTARTRLALAIAPLATVPILSLAGAATLLDKYSVAELVPGTVHVSFFFALFGLPVAYAVEGLLLVVVRALGSSPTDASAPLVCALGTVSGAVVFSLAGLGSLSDWAFLAKAGALMGAGASSLFVLIRGRSNVPRAAS